MAWVAAAPQGNTRGGRACFRAGLKHCPTVGDGAHLAEGGHRLAAVLADLSGAPIWHISGVLAIMAPHCHRAHETSAVPGGYMGVGTVKLRSMAMLSGAQMGLPTS